MTDEWQDKADKLDTKQLPVNIVKLNLPVPIGQFPSRDHRDALWERRKAAGLENLQVDDRMMYHAYDYAYRRRVAGPAGQLIGQPDDSPLDPYKDWFDDGLIAHAEEWHRRGRR
jgi:hypothetical protein